MTDLRKAAEMALDALHNIDQSNNYDAIEALRQALAMEKFSEVNQEIEEALKQPKREWVGLTDEEARDISFNLPIKWTGHLQGAASIYDFARAIEAKLKEKNT